MEPITHFLTGACLARSGFNRKTALATVTMTLAAEAPDLDLVAYVNGSVSGFACHRGATHTIWGIPLMAALVVAVVFAVYRLWPRPRQAARANAETASAGGPGLTTPADAKTASAGGPGLRPRWGWLYLLACVAGYSHLLLDFTNSYGVRPLWPWWPKWYSWDIVFIVEPLLLLVLIAGLTLPRLFALADRESGAGSQARRARLGAILALALMAVLWAVRDYEHRRAVHAMAALEYLPQQTPPLPGTPGGRVAARISAFPYMVNPFVWYGLVDAGDSYTAMKVDSLAPAVDPQGRGRVYLKPEPTPASRVASASRLGRVYLDWARCPLVETQRLGRNEPGYLVHFSDLRFMYPDSRRVALAAYVVLSPALQVEDAGFGRLDRLATGFEAGSPFGGEER
jgi:inner membrane protein